MKMYFRQARDIIPGPMLKLTRTAKNFSLILAIAKQILKEENHDTTEARLLQYATESFQRLMPKLQIEVIEFDKNVGFYEK